MAGVIIAQKMDKNGNVDISRMLKELKFKMKTSKLLKEYLESRTFEKPSDKKRRLKKRNRKVEQN